MEGEGAMKKTAKIFITFLILLFSTKTLNAFGQTQTLTQGTYNVKDTNLSIGNPIHVRIASSGSKGMIIVIDSSHIIQDIVKLGPESPERILRPLNDNFSLIVLSDNGIEFY